YSLADDQLWGVVRERKGADHTLAAYKTIRKARPDGAPIYLPGSPGEFHPRAPTDPDVRSGRPPARSLPGQGLFPSAPRRTGRTREVDRWRGFCYQDLFHRPLPEPSVQC